VLMRCAREWSCEFLVSRFVTPRYEYCKAHSFFSLSVMGAGASGFDVASAIIFFSFHPGSAGRDVG